ncbi:alpha/beta-hydrolase [Amylostereum chailletii]|nr:alpha/beta-hydrolase [Amylostereum chailletii]
MAPFRTWSLGLLLYFPLVASTPSTPTGPVLDLGFAKYLGNSTAPSGESNGPVVFFGGIPFAQPPLGDLRFRAPQPLNETPSGPVNVTDARNFALPCIQQPAAEGVGSEDCLYLNVWKPANATESSKLPVAFYIYGGGFVDGTTQGFPLYDWVAQNPGIVGVSVGYRLNALGFLAGSAVGQDGDFNNGLLDQRAALGWVQRHIRKAGEDPERVTIIGESAGAASVVMQVVAYGGEGSPPFNRAVTQSIGYGPTYHVLSSHSEVVFSNFTAAAGCSSSSDALACLRGASVASIISGVNSVGSVAAGVDGAFLPDLPSNLLRQGRFSTVDFLGGHCTNDGRSFANGAPEDFHTNADIVERIFHDRWIGVTNSTLRQMFEFYPEVGAPGSPFETEYDLAWTIAQDVVFGCMEQLMADRLVAKGATNVFTFRWNAPNPVLLTETPYEGVMHTSDLYFLFDGTTSASNAGFAFHAFNESEALLSREAIAAWTSFVSSNNPTEYAALWPAYQSDARNRMVFTRGNGTTTASQLEQISAFEAARCAFWMQEDVVDQTGV